MRAPGGVDGLSIVNGRCRDGARACRRPDLRSPDIDRCAIVVAIQRQAAARGFRHHSKSELDYDPAGHIPTHRQLSGRQSLWRCLEVVPSSPPFCQSCLSGRITAATAHVHQTRGFTGCHFSRESTADLTVIRHLNRYSWRLVIPFPALGTHQAGSLKPASLSPAPAIRRVRR